MSQQNDRVSRAAPQPQAESWGDVVRTVIYALIIALGVRTVAFEPFNIPSGSMIPTLLIGDYVFVSKFSYGYSRYSLPLGLPLFHGRIFGSVPERGDVVVFRLPTDTSQDYIKRVIGLPGDRIQMIDGILHINGEPVKRERVEDYTMETPFGRQSAVPRYIETLPNGVKHTIIEIMGDDGGLDNTPVYTVPEGHIFCMGDNRDNSQDSRVLNVVGYVPLENVVGKAQFKFFSLEEGVHFWEFWKWPTSIRFGQIFSKAH
ncbi:MULTISPECIES: signal peptidase I [Nitrospirillum]|uniref:Signal peptidase I n=1 Tax=Nitrospirillum amazonense TaxID=28077 RepID=A0A560GAM4_9PROT|nr:signal peptidase I [Nitrospirillum amazonense]MEC4590682.1 signal peptidase I [Nitrospirillum amazonense]TWB30861.1 signal peptidase I [Nitrospirillum amazonense]